MSMVMCEVPSCPLTAEPRLKTCRLHATARRAKELGLAPDAKGLGGKRCAACGRAFKDEDFVELLPRQVRRRKETIFVHCHVRCEPKGVTQTRKQKRDAPKPLLEGSGAQ